MMDKIYHQWALFEDWCEKQGINPEHEEDWRPWWDCWKAAIDAHQAHDGAQGRLEVDKRIEERERFFRKHRIECSCRVGYVVCRNCSTYYGFWGKLRLWLRGLL